MGTNLDVSSQFSQTGLTQFSWTHKESGLKITSDFFRIAAAQKTPGLLLDQIFQNLGNNTRNMQEEMLITALDICLDDPESFSLLTEKFSKTDWGGGDISQLLLRAALFSKDPEKIKKYISKAMQLEPEVIGVFPMHEIERGIDDRLPFMIEIMSAALFFHKGELKRGLLQLKDAEKINPELYELYAEGIEKLKDNIEFEQMINNMKRETTYPADNVP